MLSSIPSRSTIRTRNSAPTACVCSPGFVLPWMRWRTFRKSKVDYIRRGTLRWHPSPGAANARGTPRMTQWVYSFGAGHNEGKAEMRNLLGGKGANLAEMASIGLPVPPGFTITTEVCTYYYDHAKTYPPELEAQVATALARIEQAVGLAFGDHRKPLLVSVRSGARVSMPGMMDTVLNLGLNDQTVEGLAAASGDP